MGAEGNELYHWSPVVNRDSIETRGLMAGNLANDGGWYPPHVCLAESPGQALALCHGRAPLDLWLVHRDDCPNLRRVDQEWRTEGPVCALRIEINEAKP